MEWIALNAINGPSACAVRREADTGWLRNLGRRVGSARPIFAGTRHQTCAQGRIITAPVSRAASVSRPGKMGLAARRLLEVAC